MQRSAEREIGRVVCRHGRHEGDTVLDGGMSSDECGRGGRSRKGRLMVSRDVPVFEKGGTMKRLILEGDGKEKGKGCVDESVYLYVRCTLAILRDVIAGIQREGMTSSVTVSEIYDTVVLLISEDDGILWEDRCPLRYSFIAVIRCAKSLTSLPFLLDVPDLSEPRLVRNAELFNGSSFSRRDGCPAWGERG